MKRFQSFLFLLTLMIAGLFTPLAQANNNAPIPRLKPEAPGPIYLSRSDYRTLDQFFEALDKKHYAVAGSLRQSVKDPIARAVADWAFITSDNDYVTLEDVAHFIKTNPDWPLPDSIKRIGEDRLTDDTPPQIVVDFFADRLPFSGNGKLQLGRAYIELGQIEEGKRHLRSAWINHSWNSHQEQHILSQFGSWLTPKDHALKIDRQLFNIDATKSKRLLSLLTSRERAKAEARIALLRRDSNALRLFHQLSEQEQKDAGVLHAVTRFYRRGGEEAVAIQYALQAPLNAQFNRNPERWWYEKRLLARWALKNARYEDVYGLTAFTGLEKGSQFADAEFMAGWVALRFLNDPGRAEPHFKYLNAKVTSPISKARAQYWLGRTADAKGDKTQATLYFIEAASNPYTYYGQLAAEKIGDTTFRFPEQITPSAEDETLFNSRPMVHAMRILGELGRDREFIIFARRVDDNLTSPGEVISYDRLVREQDMIFLSVRAAKAAVYNGAQTPQVSWPHVPVPEQAKRYTEEALILGLTRQESEFNVRAYSSARARGLMQLLPSTAKITARKAGIPYSRSRLLDDGNYNMTLGAAHLNHLIDRFNGSYILTLVAYNAGANRATQWIEEYGDPRHANVDPIDWVEMIPFSETRNYVQRVMENVQIYRARIEPTRPIAGQLGRDLTRGGSTTYALERTPNSPVLAMVRRDAASAFQLDRQKNQPLAVTFKPLTPAPEPIAEPASPQKMTPQPAVMGGEIKASEATTGQATSKTEVSTRPHTPIIIDTTASAASDVADLTIDDCEGRPDETGPSNARDLNAQQLRDYLATAACPE